MKWDILKKFFIQLKSFLREVNDKLDWIERYLRLEVWKIFIKIFYQKFNPKFQCFLNKLFVLVYKINMKKYEISDPYKYKTLSQLFLRKKIIIKKQYKKNVIVSPVDWEIISHWIIQNNVVYKIKWKEYKINDFLFKNDQNLSWWTFINIYLAPWNYHRFHSPTNIYIKSVKYILGNLHTVSPKKVKKRDIFTQNKRYVIECWIVWTNKYFYYITVWACCVGKILFNFNLNSFDNVQFEILEELWKFAFGSTILLFFPKDLFVYTNTSSKVEVWDVLWYYKE